MKKKLGMIKCVSCNWQFTIDSVEGTELYAKCPKCGLLHTGDALAWLNVNLAGLSFTTPGRRLNKQFELRLHARAEKEV